MTVTPASLRAHATNHPLFESSFNQAADELERALKLVEAVETWCGDRDGQPRDPADAELMKVVWTHHGDVTRACDGCDGDCDEPCRPCTVAQAHAALDAFSDAWRKQREVNSDCERTKGL